MMNTIKKSLALLLCAVMAFGAMPVVFAEDENPHGKCGENVEWRYDPDLAVFISGTGAMYPDAVVFEEYSGDVKAIVIEEGVTTLSSKAVFHLWSTRSIVIPSTLTEIPEGALPHLLIESISIDDNNPVYASVNGILMDKECKKLIQYPINNKESGKRMRVVPEGTEEIGRYAFSELYKESEHKAFDGVTVLPSSIKSIDPESGLTGDIIYTGTQAEWDAFDADKKIQSGRKVYIDPEFGVEEDSTRWAVLDGQLTIFCGPEEPTNYTVDSPAPWAYCADEIISAVSICRQGDRAFAGCYNLKWADAYCFGDAVFEGCSSLEYAEAAFASGKDFFKGCTSLKKVVLSESLPFVDETTFAGCTSLTDIYYKGGEEAFDNTNLGELPGVGIHFNCSGGVSEDGTFWYIEDDTLTVANAERIDDQDEYKGLSFSAVKLDEGITTIGSGAFASNSSLKSIDIPESVTLIESGAFDGCDSLTEVNYAGSREQFGKIKIEEGNDCFKQAEVKFDEEPGFLARIIAAIKTFFVKIIEAIRGMLNREPAV